MLYPEHSMKNNIELPNGSKNNLIAREIARFMISVRAGERIPTVQEFQARLSAGSGTVQRALKDLEATGALVLKARQRQGSFVEDRDLGALWEIAGYGTVAGAMPLPNSREFQGLATGMRSEFERLGVPFTLLYAHSSSSRLAALNTGRVDFVVLSSAAAEQACREYPSLQVGLTLGPSTYYADNSVVVIARSDLTGLSSTARIGIDPSSFDHRRLTESEFPGGRYVDVSYVFLPHAVHTGLIDCAIWHRTALGLSLEDQGLRVYPLRREETVLVAHELSSASVVVRRDGPDILSVLQDLHPVAIREVQQKVVDLKVLPMY